MNQYRRNRPSLLEAIEDYIDSYRAKPATKQNPKDSESCTANNINIAEATKQNPKDSVSYTANKV